MASFGYYEIYRTGVRVKGILYIESVKDVLHIDLAIYVLSSS